MKMCEYQRKKIGDLSARFFRFNPGEDQGQCEPSVTGSVRVVQCPAGDVGADCSPDHQW